MSWLIRIHCADEEGTLTFEKEMQGKPTSDDMRSILEENGLDIYDPFELNKNFFDCMNSSTDTDYVVYVFKKGEADPYDSLRKQSEELTRDLQKEGLFFNSLEEYEAKKLGDYSCRPVSFECDLF